MSNQSHPAVRVCVVGVSSTGKTTLCFRLIEREQADFYIFFDHKISEAGSKVGDISRRLDVPPCRTFAECDAALKAGCPIVIFDPSKLYPGKPEEGFIDFSTWVWKRGKELPGRKIIGMDELDVLIDPRNAPSDFLALLGVGRTFEIDVFAIAQSMNALHNGVRKQFTEIFAMRQGDETGLPYLVSKGFDGNELLNLQNGLWIYKHTETGKMARGGQAFTLKNSGRDLKGL